MRLNPLFADEIANYFPIPSVDPVIIEYDPLPYFLIRLLLNLIGCILHKNLTNYNPFKPKYARPMIILASYNYFGTYC